MASIVFPQSPQKPACTDNLQSYRQIKDKTKGKVVNTKHLAKNLRGWPSIGSSLVLIGVVDKPITQILLLGHYFRELVCIIHHLQFKNYIEYTNRFKFQDKKRYRIVEH